MRIDDDQVWTSFASFLAQKHDQFSLRDLSNQIYAMSKISKLKPIILNFDDLFKLLELSLIKKFDSDRIDGQSLGNTILAYSKTQNGSVQFFQALESIVLKNVHLLGTQELSNIIYSFHRSENARADPFLLDIRSKVVDVVG